MSSNPLATVKGITVLQDDDGRVHWQSGAAVDADGSNGQNGNPFAYRKDDKGLDALANAGYPNRSWRDVLVATHKPVNLKTTGMATGILKLRTSGKADLSRHVMSIRLRFRMW